MDVKGLYLTGEAGSGAVRCRALQTYRGQQFDIGTEIYGGHEEIL